MTDRDGSGYEALVALHAEWREHLRPTLQDGVPDYSAETMRRRRAALPAWRARLDAIDTAGWTRRETDDAAIVRSEIAAWAFQLEVLQPWARDPSFYATVFDELSDVPAHEGPTAEPMIDLFEPDWPLSPADDAALAARLRGVPPLLDAARTNVAGSTARDLWVFGAESFVVQAGVLGALRADALTVRTLGGRVRAVLDAPSAELLAAIVAAEEASTDFAAWIRAQAPGKQGPSGVGKAAYDRWAAEVALSPYDWEAQAVLLQRELDRSIAALRLEEARNAALPPLPDLRDAESYGAFATARAAAFIAFLIEHGLMPDEAPYRAAMVAHLSDYAPPEARDFFAHGAALDPLPLLSHSTHWIELTRLELDPHPSPIRRAVPVFNVFADRSEGWATALEELLLHLGLYDDVPRAREIVWIMLANRAARGLASLRVQANEIGLEEAGRFHAEWTPRGWSDPANPLVPFEQLLYLRQPGYGTSYVLGKAQLDGLIARLSHEAERRGDPFDLRDAWRRIVAGGIVPPSILADEVLDPD